MCFLLEVLFMITNTTYYSPDMIRNSLDIVINYYVNNRVHYVIDPIANFSRERKLGLSTLINLIIQRQGKAIKSELSDFFIDYASLPSDSAFCQQRSKLYCNIFYDIMLGLNKSLPSSSTFKGYHILADDGSDINIPFDPNDTDTLCNGSTKNKPYSQYHLNALFDCLSGVFLDVSIDLPIKKREPGALIQFVENRHYPENSIITADRGYEGYNLLGCMFENNQKFLIRIKDRNRGGILSNAHLPENDEFDIIIKKILTRKQTKIIKENKDVFTFMPSNEVFDYLPIEKDFYEMDLRVVRFRISDEEYECLVTNLNKEEFTVNELKDIYNLRWKIETNFRMLKYTVNMICFSSKKRNNIKQEIYASIIMHNISKMIVNGIAIKEKKDIRYKQAINISAAVTNIRQFLKRLIDSQKLEMKILKNLVPVRPDRKYKRNVRPKSAKSLNHKAS